MTQIKVVMRETVVYMDKSISCFRGTSQPYIDPVFSVTARFNECKNPNKVNLGQGVYRDENSRAYVLDVVRKVEKMMASDINEDKEYLPISGHANFIKECLKLIFGDDCKDLNNGLIGGVQSISGTGAVRMSCEFLYRFQDVTCFYIPDPTWQIHSTILEYLGVNNIVRYKYCDDFRSICFDEICDTFKSASPRSGIILHACGHNPTGLDFDENQWIILAEIIKSCNLIPIIDLAYMGFVSGSIDKDVYPIRLFHSYGIEMFLCVSFAKNMSLYNERCGVLGYYTKNRNYTDMIFQRLCYMIRNTYSNPPAHGAKIAYRIFSDPILLKEWKMALQQISGRIQSIRERLSNLLTEFKTPGDWTFIKKQRGIFSYTGLKKHHIAYIEENFNIFMIDTGRINVSALNENNVEYVAHAIDMAVNTVKE